MLTEGYDAELIATTLPTESSLTGVRVGIIGGSFNPPHVGHALLAHYVLMTGGVDEIWVLPVADHPFAKHLVAFEHRMRMCQMAFAHLGNLVKIVGVEAVLPKPSYTVQMLRAVKQIRPELELTLVVGSDIVQELHKWERPEELTTYAHVLVVGRQGYPMPADGETVSGVRLDVVATTGVLPEVSSTQLRSALASQSPSHLEGFLSADVLAYLTEYSLYADPSPK